MESKTITTITLEAFEAAALKRLLGTHSDVDYKDDHQLTSGQMEIMHRLYELLPNDE